MMQVIIHAEEIIIISEEKKKNSEKERGEKGGRVEKKMFSQQFHMCHSKDLVSGALTPSIT